MKTTSCKYCNKTFNIEKKPKGWMANHTRWCDLNPKKKKYIEDLRSRDTVQLMYEGRKKTGRLNQFVAARIDGKPVPKAAGYGKPGTFTGKKHSPESKKKMRIAALNSNHRRLKKNVIEYNGITLDSTWELELAKRLDSINVEWTRPEPIKWKDNQGLVHNYFPDFYLPKYDLYLDPKNPQAIKSQKKKLAYLHKQYDNIIIIESLDECKNYAPSR